MLLPLTLFVSWGGRELYGRVSWVPGRFHVATLFEHTSFLPLWPVRSYVVVDGTEKSANFVGAPIPLHLWSVLTGYLRGWLGATVVVTTAASVICAAVVIASRRPLWALWCVPAGVLLVWLVLLAIRFHPRALLAQAGFHCLGLLTWLGYSMARDAGFSPTREQAHTLKYWPVLLIANAGLLAYSLTRLWMYTVDERAQRRFERFMKDLAEFQAGSTSEPPPDR
jgi:hypothetical protein